MKNLLILLAILSSAQLTQAQYSLKAFDINKTNVQGGSSYAGGFTAFKGKTYFYATDGIHGNELWWTDGDTTGMVADIRAGGAHGVTPDSKMCVFKDKLYFSADDSLLGRELFEYDGFFPPRVAADIAPGSADGSPDNFMVSDGLLYFIANHGTQGRQIWAYDPVAMLASPAPTTISNITDAALLNNKIVLGATNFPYNVEPCEYNLGGNSFKMLQDLNAGIDGSHPMQFTTAFNRVFFVALTPDYGAELYQYTGSGVPKQLTDNINPGSGNSVAHVPGFRSNLFRPYRNRLYFTGYAGGTWYDLCYYDPNVGNVSIAYTMSGSKAASELEVYHDRLFLSIDSNKNGITSLYFFDGTAAYNISALGVASNFVNPMGTTESNGRLFFSADGSMGNEVYVFTDSVALGVNHLPGAAGVAHLYPNPVRDMAHLTIILQQPGQLDIRVTDISGKTVFANGLHYYPAGSHKITLPLQDLAAGIYVYTVADAARNILHCGKLAKD